VALAAVVDAVIIKEPFPGADELVVLARSPRPDVAQGRLVGELRLDDLMRARAESGLELAAVGSVEKSGSLPGDPIRARVSTNFFDVLAERAILGRTFVDADLDTHDLAVIGEDLWRFGYDGDPDVIGRTVTVGQSRLTVIGVIARGFQFPSDANVWTPLDRTTPVPFLYRAIARVPPASSLALLAGRLGDWRLIPLREQLYPSDASHILVFLGAGGLLLVVVWVHVALMLAGDAVRRLSEFRLRLALGAGMRRIALGVMAEASAIVVACVGAGAVMTPAVLAWLIARLPPTLLSGRSVAIDARAAVVFVGVLVVGVFVVLAATFPVVAGLRRTGWVVADSGIRSAHGLTRSARWIVALQFAAATPVLYLLGLATYSFGALLGTGLGFSTESVLAVQMPALTNIAEEGALPRRLLQIQRVFDEALVIPGVQSIAVSQDRLGSSLRLAQSVWLPESGRGGEVESESNAVSGGYFDLLRIPVVSGRIFDPRPDTSVPESPGLGAVVIDTLLADRLGGHGDLVGREILVGGSPAHVIGIVGSIRPRRPDEIPRPRYYQDVAARPLATNLLARFTGDPVSVQRALTRLVQDVFVLPAPARAVSLEDELVRLQGDYRGRFLLMSLVGWISAALTAAGVFGIGAYTVARRRPEIAVRMALGATRTSILWLCLRDLVMTSTVGVVLGLLAGVLIGREVASLLYVVTPGSPLVLASLFAALLLVGLVGVALPIRQAWRTDVAGVLRDAAAC
jgi:predicted permease